MELINHIETAQRYLAELRTLQEECDRVIATENAAVVAAENAVLAAKARRDRLIGKAEDSYQLAKLRWENANTTVVSALHSLGIALEWVSPEEKNDGTA